MASKMIHNIVSQLNPQVIICDEAHYLKNQEAKRTLALLPFLKNRKRVILLTGTPAFAKPKEIYTLCHAIRPDLFEQFREFGNRYCDPQPSLFYRGISYEGASNTKELHHLLTKYIMVRRYKNKNQYNFFSCIFCILIELLIFRLKSQVLDQLPPKTRQKINIEVDKAKSDEIVTLLSIGSRLNKSNAGEDNGTGVMHNFSSILKSIKDKRICTNMPIPSKYQYYMENSTALNMFQKAYKLTGSSKVPGVIQFCNELFEQNIKFLVFAHHITVLDQLQANFEKKKVKFIRIDGSTKPEERFNHVGTLCFTLTFRI